MDLPDIQTYNKVTKYNQGTVGEYVDGVARTPFLMLELRANDDAEKGYNISLPANSIVSFNHERNMSDSYNTFELQIFDKDAMQVESKLLLGFRTVVFYYTDFVSTSKRYKGLILDYKTTIVNKGIMLTISGYSSNASLYVGKDSIPWSILCEANGISFYYWMNKAGEYFGEVRRTTDKDDIERYNSSEGVIVLPTQLPNTTGIDYSFKYTNDNSTSEEDRYLWTTYIDYYTDKGLPGETIDLFRPTIHKFTLDVNGYNPQLGEILSTYGGLNLIDKRPSDIVKIICIINNWSYNIVQTKKCSEIPDQLSMSYVEYIKEKLIPISVSEGSTSSTQYYFWFDDQGVANYRPYPPDETNIKKLYFNAVDHKDSYPLIGFTSSSNGSVLMAVNATNTMEAINVFTGDELSINTVSDVSTDPRYLGAVVETSNWFSTNKLTQSDDVKLITWQNKNTLPSETELRNELINRWGEVAKYTWKAQLEVYGATDLTPGEYIEVYIYLDEGKRDESFGIAEEDESDGSITYKGNLTLHHSSGRYIINKITDTIASGKYTSSLEVLKIDSNKVLDLVSFDNSNDTEKKKQEIVDAVTETIKRDLLL